MTHEIRPKNNMNKFTAILISCSLALAATAIAQQDEEQGKVKKGKDQEKAQPANEAKPAPKLKSVPKEHAEKKIQGQPTGEQNTEATGATKTRGKNKTELNTESTESGAKTHNMTKGAGKEPANAD